MTFHNDAEGTMREELSEDETLRWSGSPRHGIFFRPSDAYLIPFSLLWGGFAIFWEATVIRSHAPYFLMLWGVPFVLMGLYVTVGRFFYDAKQRDMTYYGVTTERVLIVSGTKSRTVKSLPLRTLSDVTLIESRDRRGTITFGPVTPMSKGWNGAAWPGMSSWPGLSSQLQPCFDMISEPQSVYEIIRKAQRDDGRK